ncbi:two-component response regulator [Acinetobacter sp. CAG:196]|nr:two-component response regulator [Acinetobacter sp. CAG:196]
MLSYVLIIDKRKELSVKYKKSIDEEQTSAVITRTLKDAVALVQESEPDLIIISDSIDEDLSNFCEKIRTLTYNTRPTIIALSKSADTTDRIKVLASGADDFLSEPVNIEEFKMRIKAHLRRDIESNLNNVTLLPNKKYVYKAVRRLLHSENKLAILLAGIENLDNYKSVYSDIAGDKLLQTFAAITKSALDANDFLGQLDDKNFVIITNPYSAEKMAAFLTFAFDTVTPKFYSEQDARRGYTLLDGDRKAGMRANFVSVLIGGILDNYESISGVDGLLEKLFAIKKIARIPSGSNYAIDRIKLTGENSVIIPETNRSVYISEPDEALALLLRTTLELQGYEICETLDNQPGIVILDSEDDMSGLKVCKDLKANLNFVNTKIIVTSTVHDKSAILNAGADLYLPKPYEISDLIRWIEFFFK